jgi:hypothetical protein
VTHPAIDIDAVARLRRQLGRPEPQLRAVEAADTVAPLPTLGGRARAVAARLAAPVVACARQELARAAAHEQAELRADLRDLRAELDRTRTAHAAQLAALHEQVRERS